MAIWPGALKLNAVLKLAPSTGNEPRFVENDKDCVVPSPPIVALVTPETDVIAVSNCEARFLISSFE